MHKKMAFIALALVVVGCATQTEQEASEIEKERAQAAQRNLVELRPVCRDGVEYLVSPRQVNYAIAVPHLKPDGKPFICVASN